MEQGDKLKAEVAAEDKKVGGDARIGRAANGGLGGKDEDA